jgi:hypothetical protein
MPGEAEEDHEYPYSGCGRTVNYDAVVLHTVGARQKENNTCLRIGQGNSRIEINSRIEKNNMSGAFAV